ncbi:MAG: L-threonylcarbamoyladenylate synthase [Desulfobacterales bacterium]
MKIYKINRDHPEDNLIQLAGTVVKQGGIIAFPTRCVYGLGTDAFNVDAVQRLFQLKQRSLQKPILILIGFRTQLESLVSNVSATASRIMDAFWPGRVTLVFEAADIVPQNLTAGTGKIGIRLTGHPVAAALCQSLGVALTGTSANISGNPGCYRIDDIEPQLIRQLDAILNAGTLRGGTGSTVVDVTGAKPKILREGEISTNEILTLI